MHLQSWRDIFESWAARTAFSIISKPDVILTDYPDWYPLIYPSHGCLVICLEHIQGWVALQCLATFTGALWRLHLRRCSRFRFDFPFFLLRFDFHDIRFDDVDDVTQLTMSCGGLHNCRSVDQFMQELDADGHLVLTGQYQPWWKCGKRWETW